MDPNARASFYGLSAVPRGYIDGYSKLDGTGRYDDPWAISYYSTESLKTSPIDIVIDKPDVADGVMTVKGKVTAKEFDLTADKYSIYVAIVEKSVDGNSYVLRKMLPSASGRKVPMTAKNASFDFTETWSIESTDFKDNPTLIAVAFVQSDIVNSSDERTVLQAAYNNEPFTLTFTTGIETPFLQQTALYPNPADHMVNIDLPEATANGVDVTVFDQVGRSVINSRIDAGQRSVSIDTRDLASTVYLVRLKENGVYTTKRLLITHRH